MPVQRSYAVPLDFMTNLGGAADHLTDIGFRHTIPLSVGSPKRSKQISNADPPLGIERQPVGFRFVPECMRDGFTEVRLVDFHGPCTRWSISNMTSRKEPSRKLTARDFAMHSKVES